MIFKPIDPRGSGSRTLARRAPVDRPRQLVPECRARDGCSTSAAAAAGAAVYIERAWGGAVPGGRDTLGAAATGSGRDIGDVRDQQSSCGRDQRGERLVVEIGNRDEGRHAFEAEDLA